jgi:membrane-associated phospholipid phosphatase
MDDPAATLEKSDVALGTRLAAWRELPVVRVCSKFGEIGDQGPLYVAGSSLATIGLLTHKKHLRHAGLAIVAAVSVADASKRLIKRVVTRSRPHQLMDNGHYSRDSGGSEEKTEQSFPSGHMAGSIAAARALSRDFPRAGKASLVIAAGIGISRIFKGEHWPLDIVAGTVIGLASEAVSRRLHVKT